MPLGALISGGASLLGGLFGKSEDKKIARMNIAHQKEFAQHGVRWKVDDARAAGIHPLYALGAQTHSFSPVTAGSSLSDGIRSAGQDFGRAIDATRTKGERVDAHARAIQALTLQRGQLENQLLATQIRKLNQTGSPPARPSTVVNAALIPGQGDSGDGSAEARINNQQQERVMPHPVDTATEPGAITERGWIKTPRGYAVVQSEDAKERLEEDWIGSGQWQWRNRLGSMFEDRKYHQPPYKPPPGHEWYLTNPIRGEWRSRPIHRGALPLPRRSAAARDAVDLREIYGSQRRRWRR